LNRLEVIHLNDSRDPFASLRDRHDNIGEGQVGIQVFKNILNNPKTKHLSFIIETPGFDDKGPDKKNLDILKNFIT
jgi:deoxyribonuclease-4